MLHALFNGTKLLGLFTEHEKCQLMMTGLINHGLVTREKMIIKSFFENTITEGEFTIQDFSDSFTEYEVESEPFTTASDNKHNVDKQNVDKQNVDKPNVYKPIIIELSPESKKKREEEIKEKVDIQNSLYELKRKKEKLEESKRVYNVDIELYQRFKKIKETNENFEIPEMFINKYDLMNELENDNNLNWEAFHDKYVPQQISTGYDKLFS
jgi:hypothetical protein